MLELKRLILLIAFIVNSLVLLLFDIIGFFNVYLLFLILELINMVISFILIIDVHKRFNNITSILMFFWFCYIINPILYYSENIRYISPFVHFNNLGVVFFLFGLLLCNGNNKISNYTNFPGNVERNQLSQTGFSMLVLGFIFEVINFLRVGGIQTVRRGKATYLSILNDLTITLPSYVFIIIGISLLSISLWNEKKTPIKKRYKVFSYILIIIICIFYLLISFRGKVVGMFFVFLIGKSYDKYLKKIKWKFVAYGLVLFAILQVIGSNRALISQISINNFLEVVKKLDYSVLINTGGGMKKNEFHSAGYNFMLFYNNPGALADKYFIGQSYLQGILYPIPRMFYPGTKPEQLTLVFRDIYVPERAIWGHQSTTGFSTLIEGYMNGGVLGIIIYFFSYGLLFGALEKKRTSSHDVCFHVFYLSLIPLFLTFSRTAFAIIFSQVFYRALYIFLFVKTKFMMFSYKKSKLNKRFAEN